MEASRVSRTLFRPSFDRFDGLIFEAEKPFENVCATRASPVQLQEYLFLHLFDCKPQNIVALVVYESAQEAAVGWSDSISKKRNGNHFFGVENSKKE